MNLCWKIILSCSFSYFLVFVFFIYFFNKFLFVLDINFIGNNKFY
jgi:hypothetical protein